CQHYYTTPYRF
nr:immunoglobulin light chain junction region [Macaca mulatta]